MKKLSNIPWGWLGAVAGAIGGYWYWKEIGCLTGTCPLKSQWQTMVPYGALMGYFGGGMLQDLQLSKFMPRRNDAEK
ncbi:hypothetical protein GVN20_16505 [Runella sp. CRIBMP]|uniref:YtxH domain-containing protein n=1 Tax=Runella salmonicolor TaxID=2950278 RepID=A0ABT1FKF2_9BACT|nr:MULTISPECIES: hypothetical protein [Runella]MCP1380987.1 hypothetical protein [Runella salmonicolor]NBB20971.1 hypothetical protein [Runella sp. CRIBMP]